MAKKAGGAAVEATDNAKAATDEAAKALKEADEAVKATGVKVDVKAKAGAK